LPDVYRDASPLNFVTKDDPPMLFFHGENDELVPISNPKTMVAKLVETGIPAEMHEVPGAGHLQTIVNRQALAKALSFANGHLKAAKHAQ
jgi:dipeptidyl aminopeptidase/acylaminoacyl peptidase